MSKEKSTTVRACLIGYSILLALSFFSMATPPGNLVFYVIMLGLSAIAFRFGSFRIRVLSSVLLILAVILCIGEIHDGIRTKEYMKQLGIRFEQQKTSNTNAP